MKALPTDTELGLALGINPRWVRRLRVKGMPRDLEGARQWRSENVEPRARSTATQDALDDLEPWDFALLRAVEGSLLGLPSLLRRQGMEEDAVAGATAALLADIEARLREQRLGRPEIALAMRAIRELLQD